MRRSPVVASCLVVLVTAACGPDPRPGGADATEPPPTADAHTPGDAPAESDACIAAAAAKSYVGCSYWPVDLQNAIEVWGWAGPGGDCSSFGPGVVLLPAIASCVASDGTLAGRCDPDGTCASAGANHTCQTIDACGLDAQHAVFAVVVANADPTTAADVTLADATGFAVTVAVPGGETVAIRPQDLGFPDRSVAGPGIAAAAYHLTSTQPVVAYQFNPLDDVGVFSNDASLLLPEATFAGEYRTMSYPNYARRPAYDDWRGYLTVVATAATTTVQVTPTTAAIDGTGAPLAAGETRGYTLHRFETLELAAATGDLSGTAITSDAPVGVFAGHEATVIPDPFPFRGPCCADHLEEQLLPVATWGQNYALARAPERATRISDYVRVLATRPNTVVSIPAAVDIYSTCEGVLLQPGELCDVTIHEDIEIHTSQPVLVAHYLVSGGGLGPQSGDPALAFVPPVDQFREAYTILVPDRYDANDLQLVAPTGGTITLDGADVSLVLQPFATGAWSAGRIEIAPGAHVIACPLGCSVEVGGWNTAVSYLYSGGLDLRPIIE